MYGILGRGSGRHSSAHQARGDPPRNRNRSADHSESRHPQSVRHAAETGATMSRRSGQMLVITLWIIGIVSLAVGAVTTWSTHEMRLSRFPLRSEEHTSELQS